MAQTVDTDRFITRPQVIKQIHRGPYKRAVESGRLHPKHTGPRNCLVLIDRQEYEAYLQSMN